MSRTVTFKDEELEMILQGLAAAERVRKNTLIARKQGVWQGYPTREKTEKGREISDRIGGQRQREKEPKAA